MQHRLFVLAMVVSAAISPLVTYGDGVAPNKKPHPEFSKNCVPYTPDSTSPSTKPSHIIHIQQENNDGTITHLRLNCDNQPSTSSSKTKPSTPPSK
jgi:hypothetical protein